MALADVDTGIRLGIEGHSVRTAGGPVKLPAGDEVDSVLPDGSRLTTVPGSMPGKAVDTKHFLAAILAIAIFGLRS
jgi:hypothetical protein